MKWASLMKGRHKWAHRVCGRRLFSASILYSLNIPFRSWGPFRCKSLRSKFINDKGKWKALMEKRDPNDQPHNIILAFDFLEIQSNSECKFEPDARSRS